MASAPASVDRPPAVLDDIDWRTYTRILRAFETSGHRMRLTYDRGTLEIMSPLWEHEEPAYLLGRFVDVLVEELNLPYRAGRSVTLRRRRVRQGLESDNCYWIASAARLQGKSRLDLRVDPPPDLAIERDLTHSSLDRLSIYARLRVLEVWRLDSQGLAFHVLQGGGYQVQTHSCNFPQLASADLIPFLAQLGPADLLAVTRQFRAWLRHSPGAAAANPAAVLKPDGRQLRRHHPAGPV
jgi:Uma2 family endonuclease